MTLDDKNRIPAVIDRWMLILVLLMITLVPLTVFPGIMEVALYPRFLILSILTLLFTVLWFIKTVYMGTQPAAITPLTLPILFFVIINVVSLKAAINLHTALFPLAQLFLLVILYFAIINNFSHDRLHTVLFAWIGVGGLIAAVGICQYLGLGFSWIPASSTGMPAVTFGNRNMAAMFSIMTLPVSGYVFYLSPTRKKDLISGIPLVLLVLFLLYTRTRGAWVGLSGALLATGIIVFFTEKRHQGYVRSVLTRLRRPSKVAVMVAGTVIIIGMSFLQSNIQEISGPKSTIFSTTSSILQGRDSGRLGVWRASLEMFADNANWLTGVGLNNWYIQYPWYANGHLIRISTTPFRPHNDFIWILTETGIIGFGIYIWLMVTAGILVFKIIKKTEDQRVITATLTFTTGLLAITGHSLFSFPRERITISMLFWILLAFITVLYLHVQGSGGNDGDGTKKYRFNRGAVLTGIMILIVLGTVDVGRRHLMNDRYLYRGLILYEDQKYSGALEALTQAENIFPGNWKVHYLFGLCYIAENDYDPAISWFNRCLTFHPFYFNAHYNLALAYTRKLDYVNALTHYYGAIESFPRFVKAHYNMGTVWHYTGNLVEAEKEYLTSIELDSTLVPAYNNLGALYKQQKNYEKARLNFQKALDLDSTFQIARTNLDSIMFFLND